jgi:hypothetical protein
VALRSITLKDDAALQACLVKDAAHVVQGAKGAHAKLHKALLVLDQAAIDAGELRSRSYGPTTAAAVLAYKQKRRIINFAYQKTADNIVGKMTIARLDEELLEAEQSATSNVVCRGGEGGPPGLSTRSALFERDVAAPRIRKRFDVVFQRTDLVNTGFEIRLALLMARARELMKPHGFDFLNGPPDIGPVVPQTDLLNPGLAVDTFALREASEGVLAGRAETLRVIFCFFRLDGRAFGVTDGGQLGGKGRIWKKFVLINMLGQHNDSGTLLHEMIHAAYPQPKTDHDGDLKSVFSEALAGRDRLPKTHADQLAQAYFAR